MSRTWALTVFLVQGLFGSLAGIVPLAAALAFGLIAFEYGMDQSQFVVVAGIGIGTICLLTTLLLEGRANRASSYPLVARLHHRAELLGAVVLGSLCITTVLASLITLTNLLTHRLTLDWPSALWLVPTWLAFWLFVAALSLLLSPLTSREGSHLVGYTLLVALLVASDRRAWLASHRQEWLVRVVTKILWPFSTLLSTASAASHGQSYWIALTLTLACAGVLFSLAATLFETKDLLWAE